MSPLSVPASVSQATGVSAVLVRLRLETRVEHDATERLLDLMGSALTRAAYRQRLVQFYGFYSPLEAALQTRFAPSDGGQVWPKAQLATLLPRLNKTGLLRQDLQQLGVITENLPLCRQLPPIHTQAEVLGCMYVMEGATLGGRLITRHVHATLGITPASGGRFFEGYGDDTSHMWQTMRQLLVSGAVDAPTENAIVKNAVATFACLRAWCQPASNSTGYQTENHTEVAQRA